MKEKKKAQRAYIQRTIMRLQRLVIGQIILFYLIRGLQFATVTFSLFWVCAVDSLPSEGLLTGFLAILSLDIGVIGGGQFVAEALKEAISYKLAKIDIFEKKLEAVSRHIY